MSVELSAAQADRLYLKIVQAREALREGEESLDSDLQAIEEWLLRRILQIGPEDRD